MLILPGMVNTHHHFYQTLTRNLPAAQDATLFDWLRTHYPIWARLTPEAIYVSTKVAIAELMLSGCTTSSDHCYIWPNGARLDDQVQAAGEMGFRFHAARGSMSVGESQGGLPPDSVVENEEAILRDSQRVIETYHDASRYAMLRVVLAPCSPFSVSPELMRRSAEMARAYGVHLHTHLAETRDEADYCIDDVWPHARRACRGAGLARTGCLARPHGSPRRGGNSAPGAHAYRRGALPLVEYAAGVGHRAGAQAA